jgi:alpha-ketoglutarate-dependent sulfate ester dioxygenase
MSFSVRKLTGRIGAVIEGFDLVAEPADEAVAALRGALNDYKVIVFDGVRLDDVGQQRVASWFGELTTAHPTVPAVSTLRSIVTTPYGGETLIANTAAAYRDLPEPLREAESADLFRIFQSYVTRPENQLIGDVSHYSRILEPAA